MVIKGVFINDCGFIEARLISKSLKLDEIISFLVDTGASRTTILDKDALRMGIKYNNLTKSPASLIGIGGTISCFIIPDSTLFFKSSKGDINIKLPITVAKHPLETMSTHQQTQILRLPSLLGRDIINRYKLTFDFPQSTIALTT